MLSHTELMITARQQTFSDQLCYVYVHSYAKAVNFKFNLKFTALA